MLVFIYIYYIYNLNFMFEYFKNIIINNVHCYLQYISEKNQNYALISRSSIFLSDTFTFFLKQITQDYLPIICYLFKMINIFIKRALDSTH